MINIILFIALTFWAINFFVEYIKNNEKMYLFLAIFDMCVGLANLVVGIINIYGAR